MLAGLTLPASASAAASFSISDAQYGGTGLADGIFAEGDTIDASFALLAESNWETGTGGLSVPTTAKVSFPAGYNRPFAGATPGNITMNEEPFKIKLEPGYVCGEPVPLGLMMTGPSGSTTINPKLPTGVAGAEHRYISEMVGDQIYDSQTLASGVTVGADGRVKDVRVKVDYLQHTYGLRWYDVFLRSPTGTRVRLFHQHGGSTQFAMNNVTFDDDATRDVGDPSIVDYRDMALTPDQSLNAFDGEVAKGDWILEVKDIHERGKERGGVRGARTSTGRAGLGRAGAGGPESIGILGGWSIGVANAVCAPVPDPWFGPEPLIVDPAGGTVLDGSPSVDPGTGGGITKYEWDLTPASGFEVSGASPTATFPAASKGKRIVKLAVTDNATPPNTREVSREVLITKRPVIGSELTMTPTFPQAGETVTLTATATDEDGTINTVEWDLDGDGKFEKSGSSLSQTHSWAESGPKVVRVRVTDDTGATAVRTFNVGVKNQPPKPVLVVGGGKVRADGSPAASVPNTDVILDASQTTDPDGLPSTLTYAWDLDGDENVNYDTMTGNVSKNTTQFAKPGAYPVGVSVTDAYGETATARITVQVTAKPVARILMSSTAPAPGETVRFDGTQSTDADGSIVGYQWSLEPTSPLKSGEGVQSKSYPNAGTVQVRLVVTDDAGATAEALANVRVAVPGSGGGPIGGGGIVPPVTTPTPVPPKTTLPTDPTTGQPAVPNPQVVTVPGLDIAGIATNPAQQVAKAADAFTLEDAPAADGKLANGFAAKLNAASKQKAKKVLKGGIVVKITVNAPGTVVVKGMVAAPLAKKMGLKPKKKLPLAVASGKLVFKKAGTYKFVVKVPKKYQRSVKKSKKTAITLRAAVTDSQKKTLAIGRAVVVVK